MKSISDELKNHLSGEVTTIANCWKLTRRDGTVFGFTDHDANIEFEEINYIASGGFTASAIQSSASLAVDNLDVEGIISSEFITEDDINAGLYDFAEVEVFILNYKDLSQGKLVLRCGWMGEVTYTKNSFVAEVRGVTQKLSQKIGSLYSPTCRALFGDAACSKLRSEYKFISAVTSVTSRQIFSAATLSNETGYFNYGVLEFNSGANSGIKMEVKDFDGGRIVLSLPMPYDITEDDDFEIYAGCDKTFKTCAEKFNNAVNFRGEPHVPGTDRILETAGTRSK